MRKCVIVSSLALAAIAFVWITSTWSEENTSARPPETSSARSIEEVIQENLDCWRFKPGEEVFLNRSAHPVFQVALTAAPDGRLFLAWTEGRRNTRLVVAGSPDGAVWATKITLDLQTNHVPAVAIAANAAGEVVVVWPDTINCWAVHRSSSGKWTEPSVVGEPQPEIQRNTAGSVALTVDPDGAFWLLALVGQWRELPPPRLWKREAGGAWVEASAPEFEPYRMQASLGHRGGLLSVARGHLVRGARGQGWHSVTALPWEPPPPKVSRTLALWIRPAGRAEALVWSLDQGHWSTHLVTSQDLEQWSQPAFLGWITRPGAAAVAATEAGVYAATVFEPWWWDRVQREGHVPVTWSSPRVFRIDERLTRDTDGDGLTDITEEWLLTDHQNPDTDFDGTPDAEDLDPLATTVPDTEEARICQTVFAEVWRGGEYPVVVVAPQRQVLTDHSNRVLCLTEEEAEAYRLKYEWTAPPLKFLTVEDIRVNEQEGTATARWELYSAPKAAQGGEFELEKQNGEWVVTGQPSRWVS